MACFTNVPVVSYAIPKEEEEDDDGGVILGGTGYGRWGRVFLFSKSIPAKSEVTRLLAVPLDASGVLMTFMILLYRTYSRRFRFPSTVILSPDTNAFRKLHA